MIYLPDEFISNRILIEAKINNAYNIYFAMSIIINFSTRKFILAH